MMEQRRDHGLDWRDRILAVRDRIMSHPAFQRGAAKFPLTRPIASRRAREAFDLCAGFVYSQVLFACVELGLLEILAEGPLGAADLAHRTNVPLPAMETLLAAAGSLKLVGRRRQNRWGLGARGAAFVGNAGLSAMIRHHRLLYADLRDPVALLRGENRATQLSGYWPYARADDPAAVAGKDVAAYSQLMAASQAMIADDIIDTYPFERHRMLLDVGGGEGAFLAAVAARKSTLKLSLFDLPAVAERARATFTSLGIGDRVTVWSGNFHTTPLPAGADLISLVRIIHDHDDDAARALLRAVRRALPPGGTVLMAEPMASTPGAEAMGDAYFGFYLIAMGSGRPRTPQALMALLADAGFSQPRLLATARPLLVRVITARAMGET